MNQVIWFDRGVTVNDYNKAALAEIASPVQKMKLPSIHNVHHKVCKENEDELFIDGMQISNPLKMNNLVNNFIDSPPFRLYDIFNFLICHSTSYDKQGLAAYKSFDEYRLFEDGYLESLMTETLTNELLHVYVGKVRPAMKTSTDGKIITTLHELPKNLYYQLVIKYIYFFVF